MKPLRNALIPLLVTFLTTTGAWAGECTFAKTVLSTGVSIRAVNDRGQAALLVAEPGAAGAERMTAYVWDHASWQRLRGPTESSVAVPRAISRGGLVVGSGGVGGFLVTPVTEGGRTLWYVDRNGDGKNDLWTAIGAEGIVEATAVNDRGQVAGNLWRDGLKPFLWSAGEGLRVIAVPGSRWAAAQAINEHGEVLGNAARADGSTFAFRWSADSGLSEMGDLGGGASFATAMNDNGHVVGWALTASGRRQAFLWTPNQGIRGLGEKDVPSSQATGVNSVGEVVGFATTLAGIERAFVWSRELGMQDLGGSCEGASRALSIVDGGLVAGLCRGEGGTQAVAWISDGTMLRLSGRGSRSQSAPKAVGTGAVIAGDAWGNQGMAATAVLWTIRQ